LRRFGLRLSLKRGREGPISGTTHAAAAGADRFSEAYRALRADSSIQFNLPPPDPPTKPPQFLVDFFNLVGRIFDPLGRFFRWLLSFLPDAAYARALLWILLAAGAAALLWAIYNRLRHGEWTLRLPRRAVPEDITLAEDWAPAEAGARSWLEEADALARQGRFAEAIHHLLFRSIEDIAKRSPALVRPALTSRELAAAEGIPSSARQMFARIAGLVERSLFGGRRVGEKDWNNARQAYSDFALPSAWRA